jgi:hypothetical protein
MLLPMNTPQVNILRVDGKKERQRKEPVFIY